MIESLRSFGTVRLDSLLERFVSLRIIVLGDFFLDRYFELDSALAEVSLETGRPAHQVLSVRNSPGAAGNVAANLAALGAGEVRALGYRGEDGEGWELERGLRSLGIDCSGLIAVAGRLTPTYLKPRDLERPGLLGEHDRYDLKNRVMTPPAFEEAVLERLAEDIDRSDALFVMDQVEEEGAGVVTPRVRAALSPALASRPRLVAMADSRSRIGGFSGLIPKMNVLELSRLLVRAVDAGPSSTGMAGAFAELGTRLGSTAFVTAGGSGAWVSGGTDRPVFVPAVKIEGEVDPTGAGDSFSAGALLALAAGATPAEAALMGCLAASVTVRQLGRTGVACPDELRSAFIEWRRQDP